MNNKQIDEIRRKIQAEFPRRLKSLRIKNKCAQKYVAEKLDLSYKSYRSYEQGQSIPKLKNVIKLAKFFKVSIDFLFGRD